MPRSLKGKSTKTFGDFQRDPESLVTPADLVSAQVAGSYSSIYRLVDAGEIPKPFSLPGSGRIAWIAGDIVKAVLKRAPAA